MMSRGSVTRGSARSRGVRTRATWGPWAVLRPVDRGGLSSLAPWPARPPTPPSADVPATARKSPASSTGTSRCPTATTCRLLSSWGVQHRVRGQACHTPTCRPPFLSPAAAWTPHPPPAPAAMPPPPGASAPPSAAGEQTVKAGSGRQRGQQPQAHLTEGGGSGVAREMGVGGREQETQAEGRAVMLWGRRDTQDVRKQQRGAFWDPSLESVSP